MIFFVILGFGLACVVGQMLLPTWGGWIQFSPLLPVLGVAYAALCLRTSQVFLIATMVGIMIDLLSPQRIGLSALSLMAAAGLLISQRRSSAMQFPPYRFILVLAGTYFYQIVDYLLYSAQLQRWFWPQSLWTKMMFPSLTNLAIALILIPAFDWIARQTGWMESPLFMEDYDRT